MEYSVNHADAVAIKVNPLLDYDENQIGLRYGGVELGTDKNGLPFVVRQDVKPVSKSNPLGLDNPTGYDGSGIAGGMIPIKEQVPMVINTPKKQIPIGIENKEVVTSAPVLSQINTPTSFNMNMVYIALGVIVLITIISRLKK